MRVDRTTVVLLQDKVESKGIMSSWKYKHVFSVERTLSY